MENQNNNCPFQFNREIMRANEVAQVMGLSLETIYDWKYRPQKRKIPAGMFMKVNRMLFIQTRVLTSWIDSQTEIK